MLRKILSVVLLAAVLVACSPSSKPSGSASVASPTALAVAQAQPAAVQPPAIPATTAPTQAATTTAAPTAASTSAPTSKDVSVGPDSFPAGVNPLTGLPVQNSAALDYSPALVSVTNFPVTARPQAGLSFSPFVYEMYIGEGMTRFLALFYGDYPQKGGSASMTLADDKIGPVRSGRLPYESLRKLYNGFLIMASADPKVLTGLGNYNNVFGSDAGDINSALISATRLEEIASKNPDRLKPNALTGLRFESSAPAGGKPGKMLWIPYNFLNQVIWRYDASSGAYHRYQDNADGKTFIQATDRLNGSPLAYSNVVVLFANHVAQRETLINIDLMYQNKMPALLFRDGKMYEISWTTANDDYEKKTGLVRPIRFIDAQGKPFPLKPGQTWVEIVQQYTPYNETVDSESYFELKNKVSEGSGNWAVHFFPTVPEK